LTRHLQFSHFHDTGKCNWIRQMAPAFIVVCQPSPGYCIVLRPRYTSRTDGPSGRPVWCWSRHSSPVSRHVTGDGWHWRADLTGRGVGSCKSMLWPRARSAIFAWRLTHRAAIRSQLLRVATCLVNLQMMLHLQWRHRNEISNRRSIIKFRYKTYISDFERPYIAVRNVSSHAGPVDCQLCDPNSFNLWKSAFSLQRGQFGPKF